MGPYGVLAGVQDMGRRFIGPFSAVLGDMDVGSDGHISRGKCAAAAFRRFDAETVELVSGLP